MAFLPAWARRDVRKSVAKDAATTAADAAEEAAEDALPYVLDGLRLAPEQEQLSPLVQLGILVVVLAALAGLAVNSALVYYTWVLNEPVSFEFTRYVALFWLVPLVGIPLLMNLAGDQIRSYQKRNPDDFAGLFDSAAPGVRLLGLSGE